MLISTINTKQMQQKVLKAARKHFGKAKGVNAIFEHGHWWITLDNGAQYDVVDAEGPGTTYGFDFEMVTPAQEE